MSEQTPIEITQILKESPNLPKANEIGYFFMENQVVWAMEEYAKQMLKQLQAKHDEELKRAVIKASKEYIKEFELWHERNSEVLNKQYGTDLEDFSKGRIDALTSVTAFIEQYYKANHETNEQANQNNSSNDTRRTID